MDKSNFNNHAKIALKDIAIREVVENYIDSAEEGFKAIKSKLDELRKA